MTVMTEAEAILATDKGKQLVWGWLRLFLGLAQMILAPLAFGVLIITGLSKLTLLLTVAATAVTVVSRFIYHGRRRPTAR